uniref:Trypsin n=1 Tax=Polyandrocarpa misakiensis TaxID=7723 RepID=Q3V5L6_POLMI|nr:trypsin [Polyandrocarpa misakiensis]
MKVLIFVFLAFCGANADKIIGGSAASNNQFPSIVFQEKSGSFFCGGTLINANHVLTAAHCEQNLIGLTVTAGTTTRNSGGVTISVSSKTPHENYNSNTFQNDIMILTLASSYTTSSSIGFATLAFSSPSAGAGITVAGWGDTNSGVIQSLPNNLQYVNVAVISTSDCNARTAYNGQILSGMICMGNMSGGEDSCQGDSGGPAYLSGTTTVAGVTSWGYGCAQANKPGVYTDVAYFRSWINSNS